MKPKEAGFDGEKGVNLNIPHMKGGGVYCLRRGKKPPIENLKRPFNNQLCWYYPDGQDPKLLYCNDGGKWFNLSFEPVNVEEL